MIPCLILGDSHAVATAAAVRAAIGERCAVIAENRVPSASILKRAPRGVIYNAAVISAGANDADNPDLPYNLDAIRKTLRVGRVVWLLPYNRQAAASVQWVANRWGDSVIDLAWARPRKDGIHCMSYSWVARSVVRYGYAGPIRVAR